MRAEIPIKSKRGIEYDLLDALSRNPLIIMAGDDICGAAKAEIERLSAREADLKAKLEKARTALRNLRNECSGKPRTDMLLQLIKEADEALT